MVVLITLLLAVAMLGTARLGADIVRAKSPLSGGTLFSGQVLHWTQSDFDNASTSPDPANHQQLTIDIWEAVGVDSVPTVMHSLATLPDGSLHQEILQTPQSRIMVFGRDYVQAGLFPKFPSAACTVETLPSSKDLLAKTLPEFADPSALTLAGFAAVSGHPSTALPFTADINGVMPSTVFATPSDVVQWSGTRVQANRAVNHQQIEVDSQNRVVVEHGWLTDSSGALQVDHSTAYGALFAYAPSTVPSSALQLSAQSASQCQSVTKLNTSPSNPISSASNATVALVQPAAASRRPAITQKAGTFGVVGLSGISLASIQLPTIAGSIPGYYECKYAYWIIGNYSEVIQGNACRTFYQMANFWWGTQADTTTMNTEYFVQTYGNAFDTCNGRDWTWRMSIPLNTSYYTNYSVSPANAGYYSDCGQYDNHVYWVQAEHAYNLGGNNGSVTVEQNAYW